MTVREYESYTTRILASGEVRRYPVTRTYLSNRSNKIANDVLVEILRRAADGVPAARIARDIGISAERVRRIVKKAAADTMVGVEEQKNM